MLCPSVCFSIICNVCIVAKRYVFNGKLFEESNKVVARPLPRGINLDSLWPPPFFSNRGTDRTSKYLQYELRPNRFNQRHGHYWQPIGMLHLAVQSPTTYGRSHLSLTIVVPTSQPFLTRGCGRWGAARYGAVFAVSLLWEFRFPYELRLTYLKRYGKRSRHGTDGQTDTIDTWWGLLLGRTAP